MWAASAEEEPSWYNIGTRTRRWAAWAMFAASSSAASCRFHLLRRFWNQILTCVSVRWREAASPARSDEDKYRFMSKVLSSWNTWERENTVRVFFLRRFRSSSASSCVPPAVDADEQPMPPSVSPPTRWSSREGVGGEGGGEGERGPGEGERDRTTSTGASLLGLPGPPAEGDSARQHRASRHTHNTQGQSAHT